MLKLRLEGRTYQHIASKAGVSRQRIQQILSPPAPIRNYVVEKYEGYCFKCGIYVGYGGHVHHDGGNGEDYDDAENLLLLCISCHRRVHATPPQFQCLKCGKAIRSGIFCSRQCFSQYHTATLSCSYCGNTFTLQTARAYQRTDRSTSGQIYCSKSCQGKWLAEQHGFQRKWDYEKIFQARDDTGFGPRKLSRLLNIPEYAISRILRKRQDNR